MKKLLALISVVMLSLGLAVDEGWGQPLLLEDYNSGTPGDPVPGWANDPALCTPEVPVAVFYQNDFVLEGAGAARVNSDNCHTRFFPQTTGLIQIDLFARPKGTSDTNSGLHIVGMPSFASQNIISKVEPEHAWRGGIDSTYRPYVEDWYEIIVRINTSTNRVDIYLGRLGETLQQVEDELPWIHDISDGLVAIGLTSGRAARGTDSHFDIVRVDLLDPNPGTGNIPNITPLPIVRNTWSAAPPFQVALDIKPGSCPNPLNFNNEDLPAAILGTADFDVTKVDTDSVRLEGIAPLRSSLEDVATPFEPFTGKQGAEDCTNARQDGFQDLTLKFDKLEVVAAFEAALGRTLENKEVLVLELTGNLTDGTPILGEDVVIVKE